MPNIVGAYPLPDQTSLANVYHVICRHEMPCEQLSDRDANFFSELTMNVCQLTGMIKVNTTTVYHPKTDELVETFYLIFL